MNNMDPRLEQTYSDAEAICACFGPLAIMVMDAAKLATDGVVLEAGDGVNERAKRVGTNIFRTNAAALKLARQRIDKLMQDFGDHFNNGDACSASMMALTEPMYEILRKRRAGIGLDDESVAPARASAANEQDQR